ncbi:O-antigen ligase family protein, partial [Candidatus Parcubacteria bacterium]|nr:O-antigen ligase family protein [Candidatus Parcubacteria bacterium]
MTQIKISKYLNWALKGVLYLILITPLLISSRFIFPFITTKTMFFRIAVELAIILYSALAMIAPQFRPRMTKLSWLIVTFGGIILLTGITGVDFYKTFWGTIERGEGFLTIAHLIIYFLLLTWTFKSKKEILNYITVAVAVGLLVDLYAILQRAQVEKFLFWRIIHSGEGRLSATIGNAAFMGAFSLAQFFLSLLLFLKRKQLWWKIITGLAIIINLYVLYQTQTRGAAIGLVIVAFLTSIFYFFKSPDKIKKRMAGIILLVIIISGSLVWINKDSSLIQSSSMLRRLVSISKTDITTESRIAAWETSWNGWEDRFIFGYGWENYNIAFNRYFPAIIFKDAGSQLWFDRAHNTIFDIAVATGLIGLICY